MRVKLATSILSADFARIADEIGQAESAGADWIHLDVMDGHFVPNLTIGPPVVRSIRRVTRLPLDVHLMIEQPQRFIEAFADAGADIITVHQEACVHLHRGVEQIRSLGKRAGVAINPGTPVDALSGILPFIDLALVMSVNPGFGGQRFIPTTPSRIATLRDRLVELDLTDVEIEVDGGIGPDTAEAVVRAGATVLVAGAAIFNEEATVLENTGRLRSAAGRAPTT